MSQRMGPLRWWLRMHVLQWMHSASARPAHASAMLMAWWLPCILAPSFAAVSGSSIADSWLHFVLSLDVPLALVVAALTVQDALGIASGRTSEQWLWPHAFRPTSYRWVSRLRWLRMARWPAGLALGSSILAARATEQPEELFELCLMALLGLISGTCLMWAMAGAKSESRMQGKRARRGRGLSALSWAPLHEARDRFELRRISVLAIPALLAAPVGALAVDAAKLLTVWLLLLAVSMVHREARNIQSALHSWLRVSGRIRFTLALRVWRYVVAGLIAIVALFLLWPGVVMNSAGRSR